MPDNVFTGQNVVYCHTSTPVLGSGVNSGNTSKIFDVLQNSYAVYQPTETIQQFYNFEAGHKYLLIATQPFDLTAYVYPPFPTGGGVTGPVIGTEDGTPIEPE